MKCSIMLHFIWVYNVCEDEKDLQGAQWLSGRVLDSRLRGCRFEPHRGHCFVSLSETH